MSQPVALITGAASGIGAAVAVAFARKGVRVVGGYLAGGPHDPAYTQRRVEEAGAECLMMPMDVTDSTSVDAIAGAAFDRFGRLDYAIANAGLLRKAPLMEMSDEQWNEMLDVDLTGVMRTFRSASRYMGEGGAMVAISSIAGGVYGWQDHSHYAAAKAGVPGLCRSLAVELAARGIRCNAVIPGLIETPQSLDSKNSLGADGLAKAGKGIPLGRIGRASEVADLVCYLSGSESSYITGQSIIIDGGLTVRWPE
ncbi:SDR family NAD(P)-dependent oxidoreductase [Pseudomonas kurunegalensis]|uniref:SDR family NAD(P)-dependent oxidoreductase n=1 Tax=Pseudomonas kurunegalensis TaxID=485880 RepID=UPI0025701045|nr:SDR family NAD(P)-dependent oxidoreductase [Pseudomonas kurunegalensis]WJD64756.1 SDR family NAD(P)-dependent oxidoreductase [Pseudomonas kurunegalensis]